MKTAIVTGASGNMGQAVIKKFIDEGYKVIGTVIPNDPVPMDFPEDKLEKVVVDLMNEDDSAKFIASVISKYGSIDAAVLTVGGFAMGAVAETKTSDIGKQYKLNFETAYNVARPVFVQMLKQNNGRIFIIGSRPGLDATHSKGVVAYGLAKSLIHCKFILSISCSNWYCLLVSLTCIDNSLLILIFSCDACPETWTSRRFSSMMLAPFLYRCPM